MSSSSQLAQLIGEAVAVLEAAEMESPRREAEALASGLLGLDRAAILTHPEQPIDAAKAQRYRSGTARRARREPLAYITGEREFWSLPIAVTRDVLIPRPATEHLVEAVIARVPRDATLRILDVGTGSGAIVVALAHELPGARFVATDVSERALRVARRNVVRFGLRGRVALARGDLFDALTAGQNGPFDVIVSNPPYVRDGALPQLMPDVRDWEPIEALRAGPDGLDVIRRLVAGAPPWLVDGGWLAVEHGEGQGPALAGLLAETGFEKAATIRDLEGHERVAVARWLAGSVERPKAVCHEPESG